MVDFLSISERVPWWVTVLVDLTQNDLALFSVVMINLYSVHGIAGARIGDIELDECDSSASVTSARGSLGFLVSKTIALFYVFQMIA